ncbi:pentatricopeptide repeat-containing protein At2g30780 [Neltuma alba]|uniref:pentatricopeptide repeat-containing protein At2g30780 n=1 Tax=Neltuma alba TaxID=207710 RepID=UPI0010A2D93D|nr:pentatricopeptide repeat-containing protein At2g30780-like [Prosopis alba]XP_028800418.1 pentatricopeptide repeat-containing protein At2g30780-like [Prosopis alba]
MKRAWKLSDAAQAELFCFHKTSPKPKPRDPFPFFLLSSANYACTPQVNAHTRSSEHSVLRGMVGLFSRNPYYFNWIGREDFKRAVANLGCELVRVADDPHAVLNILEENSHFWFWSCPDGTALVDLLDLLESWPHLSLMVLNWRRKSSLAGAPMAPAEYSKAIKVAGRSKNIDLAVDLFNDATTKQIKTTAIYNSLMAAYMFNGLPAKCKALFVQMKKDGTCHPNIITFNILISVYGRLVLIDRMEAIFEEIHNSGLSPNISTYNYLIAGYVTAWKWDKMEQTFRMLNSSPFIPDTDTYLLMLRGYAYSGNLKNMEETYQLVRDYVNENEIPLIRCMICAYCKSSEPDRVKKIQELLNLIPENEYRPWLNVLLIRLYAQENSLEEMENSINEAFQHKVSVKTSGIMRCIIATYFRKNLVDKLENFVRRAEHSDWRICRSLYHCKMVMYGSQQRFEEMESVLNEMESVNMSSTKKTLWILYNAYVSCDQRSKVMKILGLMCKRGFDFPMCAVSS